MLGYISTKTGSKTVLGYPAVYQINVIIYAAYVTARFCKVVLSSSSLFWPRLSLRCDCVTIFLFIAVASSRYFYSAYTGQSWSFFLSFRRPFPRALGLHEARFAPRLNSPRRAHSFVLNKALGCTSSGKYTLGHRNSSDAAMVW